MSAPFVAEIRIFPFNFAPKGWAQCNGQLLPLSQNTALFSLVGTFYGGDGKSTFALPNMMGNVPIHQGQGNGLSEYFLGQTGGSENVSLLESEIPSHNHSVQCALQSAAGLTPGPTVVLGKSNGIFAYTLITNTNIVSMSPNAIAPTGGDLPHNNMMPYLALNFCIALQGIFPPRP